MKNKIMLLLAFALAVSTGVSAQQGGGPRKTAEERTKMTVEKLSKDLSLNKEQQTKLDTVYLDFYKKMDKMRESGERPDMQAFQKMGKDRDEKVKTILTGEQFKKYEEMQAAMRQRREGRGGGGGRGN